MDEEKLTSEEIQQRAVKAFEEASPEDKQTIIDALKKWKEELK